MRLALVTRAPHRHAALPTCCMPCSQTWCRCASPQLLGCSAACAPHPMLHRPRGRSVKTSSGASEATRVGAIQRRRISGRARTRVLLQARASVRWLAETLCAQTLCVCACWVVCDRVLLAGCGACGGVVACCRRPAVLFPIEEWVCAGGDGGQPVVLGATSETPVARLFMRLAASVVQQVPLFQSGGDGPRVVLRLSPARVPPPASYSLCAASWLQVCVQLTCRDTPRAV